jgi:hypothetical protein
MNTQNLLDCIKASENSESFDLNLIVSECGTYGCLVGNHLISLGMDSRDVCLAFESLENREFYGLTKLEYQFLFGIYEVFHSSEWGTHLRCGFEQRRPLFTCFKSDRRNGEDKESALNRIRKLIYYKLHKKEMMYDERGCVRESARKAGHVGIAEKVVESLTNEAVVV